MIKKILTWGGLAFLIFFVVTQPDQAGGVVRSLAGGLGDIGNGLGGFISNIVSG
jgi:hypothetical protein